MADRLLPAQITTTATRKIRLADFATGRSDLRPEHRIWLEQTLQHLTPQDQFSIDIFGYASKLGPAGSRNDPEAASTFNRQLSYDRANSAARYMETLSNRVTSRIRQFAAMGSDSYSAPNTDDSSVQRAVEVHVYPVPVPPPPPPGFNPLPPMSGGRRYSDWAVAAPASVSEMVVPGALVAANLVVFRCKDLHDETRAYLSPALGPGGSWGPTIKGKFFTIIKAILGRLSLSGISFTDATAVTPFNFKDLEGATCMIGSGGGGFIVGAQACLVSVYGKLWYRLPNGQSMHGTREFVTNVNCSGVDLQYGVSGGPTGGPLIRVA
jgi:hypothetical protein